MGKQEIGSVALPNDGPSLHKSLNALISVPFEYEFVDELSCKLATLNAQLGRIQKFRSHVIHHSLTISNELYRLLIEWMLSSSTPVNLRRSLASLLRTFHYNNDTQQQIFGLSDGETIAQEVLDSILLTPKRSAWLNPVISIKEFVAWKPEMVKTPRVATFLAEAQAELTLLVKSCTDPGEHDIARAVEWSSLVETILSRNESQVSTEHLQAWRRGLWTLLSDAPIPTEDLSTIAIAFARTAPNIDSTIDSLPDLALLKRSALLQGLAAACPLKACLETIHPQCHSIALSSTEPLIRTLALKGIRSIVSRLSPDDDYGDETAVNRLQDTTLDLALQSWENPQCRRLAASVKALFQELVRFMQSRKGDSFDGLLFRVLDMSVHRKGRYTALEILLPVVGPHQLLSRRPHLLDELVKGMTDRGHSTGPIADLWAKLLRQLLINKQHVLSHEGWVSLWIPSVAKALVSPLEISRRRRLADFCIPRLLTSVVHDNEELKTLLFVQLLSALGEHRSTQKRNEPPSKERETGVDRVLFAELEVIRRCSGLVFPSNGCSDQMQNAIRQALPPVRLRVALAHFCPHIRLFAFKCLETVGPVYDNSSPWASVKQELSLWLYALPLSTKTDDKEFRFSLFLGFVRFLDRFSLTEAAVVSEQDGNDEQKCLDAFPRFVSSFLLGDLLEKVGYPGAPPSKGAFMLGLLEALIVFSCRDHPMASSSKFLPKTSAVYRRRRQPIEESAMHIVRHELLHSEVFCALFTSVRSPWDNIRSTSYNRLRDLVDLGNLHSLPLPQDINSSEERRQMEARAIALASSPRPRESDSGSLILAYLAISSESKVGAIKRLLLLFEERLSAMQSSLADLSSGEGSNTPARVELPLSHGIVRALHLSLAGISRSEYCGDQDILSKVFACLLATLLRALRTSLSVVADVSDGHNLPGLHDEASSSDMCTPINPGAIGANGIFQSVERRTKHEAEQQIASQRIVVGSWLLTKETCQAISSLLTFDGNNFDTESFEEAGTLLISTMTSLKHTGAAYAAHNALQEIATECLRPCRGSGGAQELPQNWIHRLLKEVQSPETIRDSTLRRSQGYSLAFVALFRSATSANHTIDEYLSMLINLSFPDQDTFQRSIGCARGDDLLSVNRGGVKRVICPVKATKYNPRSRIHALNTLRLIVQDAALSKETKPFLGVGLVAASVGFTDSEWGVRNSSTMVFASAMLQAVDSDKNASNSDNTGNTSVSAHELFRSYPQLPTILRRQLLDFNGTQSTTNLQLTGGLPPFLPILVLFARIHPIVASGQESAEAIKPFIPILSDFADHKLHSVRKAAARALRNCLSSGSDESLCSYSGMVKQCIGVVKYHQACIAALVNPHWNRLHGALLIMKEVFAVQHIQNLLPSSTTSHVSSELSLLLNDDILLPPPCVSVAFELLSDLRAIEFKTHWRFVRALEVQENHFLSYQVGAPALGHVLGTTITTKLCDDIQDQLQAPVCDQAAFNEALERLSSLISSTSIDVRIQSVKQMKKRIYGIVDAMRDRSCAQTELVKSFGIGLYLATMEETQKATRKHPPCIRRLSRCFLEYVDALGSQIEANGRSNCFHLSEEMLRLLSFQKSELPDFCIPSVVGNALELLAVGISVGNLNDEHLSQLFSTVDRISNQSCHWRLRHSAATSLRHCWARTSLASNDVMLDRLLNCAVVLLEDEDIDVRLACIQALANFQPDGQLAQAWSGIPESSYFAMLEILEERNKHRAQPGTKIPVSSRDSFPFPQSLPERLFGPIEHEHAFRDNFSDDEAIFEEELANEYEEVTMQGDWCYLRLQRFGSEYPDDRISVVMERAIYVLNRMKSALELNQSDKADHISRRLSVFPSLYNLLLICHALLGTSANSKDINHRRLRRIASSLAEFDTYFHKRIQLLLRSMDGSSTTAPTMFLVPACEDSTPLFCTKY